MAYIVSSGETSDGIILTNDSMTVLDGGTANNTTVNKEGRLIVSYGGAASGVSTTLSGFVDVWGYMEDAYLSGGIQNQMVTIYQGGVLSSATVIDGVDLFVSGSAFNIVLDKAKENGDRSDLFLCPGGYAENITVNSGGYYVISGGATAVSNTLNNGGLMYISNGGTANSVIVSSGGALYVSSGGTASIVFNPWQGNIYSSSRASITYLERTQNVYYGCGISGIISSAEVFEHLSIEAGNSAIVYSGGKVDDPTVKEGGCLNVSSGGTANNVTVNNGGKIYVSSGGTANNVTFSDGGSICVSSGGTALNIVCTPFYEGLSIANDAYVTYNISDLGLTGVYYGSGNTLYSSALALDSIDMDSGTSMLVFSDGTATKNNVNESANIQISSGGTANSTTVNSGGKLFVSSGGTATDIKENGGYVEVADDADITFAANILNDFELSNAAATIHSGTTANNAVVDTAGILHVSSGGVANSTTVNNGGNVYVSTGGQADSTTVESGGKYYVFSGGSADSTMVNSGGYLYVSNSGLANSTTVNNGGYAHVSTGGTATDTTVNYGGNAYVVDGGSANGVTVNSGGVLNVSSGGTATNVTWTPCFGDVAIEDGAHVTFASDYSGVYYGSNNVFLSQAQVIESTAISGTMCVISDGAVNKITVNNGADLRVFGGGMASNTTVNNGGNLHVFRGGEVNNTVNGGYFAVLSGGVVKSTTVNNGGGLEVFRNGVANSTTINSGGYLNVSYGGTASDVIVQNRGWINVYDGGTLSNATAIQSGRIYVYTGGAASSTIVQNNAVLYLGFQGYEMGGFADKTTVNSGGSMFVSSNGKANNTTVNSFGILTVSIGGTANSTTVNSRGYMFVTAGGTATEIIENGGYVNVAAGAEVSFQQHSFSGLGLQNASATIHSGTTANSVTVSSGGQIQVFDHGVVNSAAMYSNGVIYISSGGSLTGRTYCLGGIIYAYDGAIVNYDLIRTNPGAFALISDLSCIQGTAKYTITVKAGQAEGTYILADVASAFDQTITVENTVGDELGILSVGETVAISGVNYTLNLTDNTLSLTIGEKETPSPYTSDGLFFWNETGSIQSGELFHDTLILSGGSLIILGKGSANSATVSAGGYLHVSSAAAAHAIVENGGYVTVEDGAEATFVENTINGLTLTRASATLHSNTTANNATVNISGYLDVYGGTANGATIYSSGYLRVYSGGSVNSTTVYSGGYLNVSNGGTVNNTIISGYHQVAVYLNVSSGGIAYNTTVSGGYYYGYAYFNVYNGGVASNAIVGGYDYYANGYLNVFSGGTANNATIITSGYFTVSSGGMANNATVNGGEIYVFGTANSTTVIGGNLYISNGGTANNTTANGGAINVRFGGTADDTTLNARGVMHVSSGGTATEIKENGGYVDVQNGANAAFASHAFSGVSLDSGASATVHSGTTAVNLTLNQSSYLAVYSGGSVTDLVWTPCNGTLWIEDGAYVTYACLPEGVFYGGGGVLSSNAVKMEEITLLPNQNMYVMSNGIANSTTISSGGSMFVSNAGLANSTTVLFGGNMVVSSGGTANNVIVYSSGYMRVISGGTAAHIEASSGARLDMVIAPDTYIEGTYADSAFEIKDGSATYYSVNSGNILRVSSGGVASRTYVYTGGNLYISNGGTANRTVLSNGAMSISSGGVATSTTINYGSVFILSGGTADTAIVNNGALYISNGGCGNAVTMNNETGLYISSGGTVNDATVNYNAWLYVSAGGTATNLTAPGTRLRFDVSSDTYITGTSAGFDFEIKNGIVSGYTVASGGNLNILSGCVASGIYTTWSGFVTISSGGLLKDSYLSGGIGRRMVTVEAGGIVSSVQVVNCVDLFVSGSAYDIVLKDGRSNDKSDLYLCGGYAENVTVSSYGYYDISSSGMASNTIVNQGGSMLMTSGGVASDLRINSGGYLSIQHAKLTGKITIEDGGVIHAGQGTVIDFDISRLAPNMGALLNNLSLIQDDAPAFTLTVSDLQWNGTYRLAQGVTEFDNLISVKSTASQTIHMVAVDETANVDGVEYTLKLTGDTLSVTVTGGVDIPVIPVSADVTDPTRSPVTVTADFSDAAIMREYSFDNDTWHVYTEPVTFRQNGTVYFLGKDQRGFINETASYEVTNIDLTPPVAPTVSADITELTNTDVLVTAEFSEDAKLREYSYDGKTWLVYTDAVIFEQNGTVYFRAIDALGNESEVVSYSVVNIDKIPPVAPTARANITNPTNQPVSVSASFSNDSVKREYSLDGQDWSDYTSAIQFASNGTVYFRATDAVGNISEITEYKVENIDTARPDKPKVSADVTELTNTDVLVTAEFSEECTRKEYSLDGNRWRTYSGAVRFSGNGTVFFRGIDAAGNESEVESYTVDYIDKSAPTKPTAYADVTNITNGNVFVSAVYSDDSVAYEYSFDNEKWEEYTDAVMFTENGTVYFRGVDEAGNYSGVTKYVVSNIDKTAPAKPTAYADVTEITSGDVLVSAVFSNDSAVREYSLDGRTWKPYTEAVRFVKNGNIYFRSFDTAGNVSEVAGVTVNNIIKAAPEKPGISVDVTEPTSGAVTVSAVFSDEFTVNQYSLDGETWMEYTGAVSFDENGFVCFRSVDVAGNESEVVTYTVSNIDKTPPEKPIPMANITEPTNMDVLVTAIFSEDSVVKQYSLDGENWGVYPGGVLFGANLPVYFRSIDAAGNISEVASYTVTNVDRSAPVITLTGDNQTPTRQATLTAAVDDGSTLYYSKDDSSEWTEYKDAIIVLANASYSFRATDAAGNTGTSFLSFENLQKPEPVNAPDNDKDDYLSKNGKWNEANIKVSNVISSVTEEISLDEKGTIDDGNGKHNMFGNDGTNKDAGDVAKVAVEDTAKLTFSIDSTAAGTFYVYEKVDKGNGKYKQVTVGKVTVKADTPATLGVSLDDTGNYYVAMKAKSTKKGTAGYYNVNVTGYDASVYEDADDGGNDTWATATPIEVGRNTTSLFLDSDESNFVGFSDPKDYAKLELESSAYMSFGLESDGKGKVKFTLWKQKIGSSANPTKVTSKTLTTTKYKDMFTAAKFLDTSKYVYYISMESTDAAKGGAEHYTVSVKSAVFFDPDGDKVNKYVYSNKKLNPNLDKFRTNDIAVSGEQEIFLDSNEIKQEGFSNFVGYNDKTDYAKLSVASDGDVTFTITTSGAGTFTVYRNNAAKKKLEVIGKVEIKAGQTTSDPLTVSGLKSSEEYFISMTAKSTKANATGSVFYKVIADATLSGSDGAALDMPETSGSLAMTDALSFGQYDTSDVLADASASALTELDDKTGWLNISMLV